MSGGGVVIDGVDAALRAVAAAVSPADGARGEAEEQVRRLVDLLPVGVYACDATGRITMFNRRAVEIWGREPMLDCTDRLFCGSHRVWPLSGGEERADEIPMALALRNGACFRNVEVVIERPDGGRLIASVNIDPLFDSSGALIGAVNVFHDVTERKRVEAALRDSEERHRQLVANLPVAVYLCDAVGRVTLFNAAAAALWGREPEIGKDMWCGSWRIFEPDGTPLPLERCPMAVALREGRPVRGREIVVERPDGTRRNVLPHPDPLRDASGAIVGAMNMLMDVTEARSAERAHALLAAIVTSSDDAIISKTLEGVVTSWNNGAERIFGYTAEEAVGRSITLIIPEERLDEEKLILSRLRAGRRIDHFRTVRRAKDGRMLDISLTVSPVRDRAGRIIGVSKVARDITIEIRAEEALKRSEAALEQAVRERTKELRESHERLRMSERMASLGTLSAGLGHDMGNLLLPVRVSIETLERSDLPEALRDDVSRIRTASDYLQRLANGLRLLAINPESSRAGEPTELRAWWTDTAPIMKNCLPRGVELAGAMEEGCLAAIAPSALTQAVFNLVQNAGEAMAARGWGAVSVSGGRDQQDVVIRVSDDGPGMTPEVRARCMEPFFTRKARGISTGLGLVLVSGLVREAGGSVALRTAPGEGAAFELRLPVAGRAVSETAANGRAMVELRDLRSRAFVAAELRSIGFTVLAADEPPDGAVDLLVSDDPAHANGRARARKTLVFVVSRAPGAPAEVVEMGERLNVAVVREAVRAAADEIRARHA